jgi:serine/threonine protein kinase
MGYKKGEILKTAFDAFIVEGLKGAGGSGEVYEVRDSDRAAYAAKILDPERASSVRLKRFRNEINFCAKTDHRNIVKIVSSGITANGATFYVMPLYSGTLRELMARDIAPERILPYFGQILDGVEAAHLKSVWHRDLKPENILFSESANELVVADFGIAHFEEEELLTAVETQNNDRLANFLYAAPEQRARGQKVGSKADVYALGLILNEMFTGAVPLGTDFSRISEKAPNYAYLDELVGLMLRQDPSRRPSIAEVKRELIGRGNEFLSLQRLSSLKSEVIPDTEADDPLIANPIRIVDIDYREGQLVFKLSAEPTPNWIMAFKNPRQNFPFYHGAEPVTFGFGGNSMGVRLPPGGEAAQLVRYASSYIDMANEQYRGTATAAHQQRLADEREQLRRQIEEEEHRKRILAEVRELKF